jgi:hypothetical protein
MTDQVFESDTGDRIESRLSGGNGKTEAAAFYTPDNLWLVREIVHYGMKAKQFSEFRDEVIFSAALFEDGKEKPPKWVEGCCLWVNSANSPYILNSEGFFPVLRYSIRQWTGFYYSRGRPARRIFIDDIVKHEETEYVVRYGGMIKMKTQKDIHFAAPYTDAIIMMPLNDADREGGYTFEELTKFQENTSMKLISLETKFAGRWMDKKAWYDK